MVLSWSKSGYAGAISFAILLAGCHHIPVDQAQPLITVTPSKGAIVINASDRYAIYKVVDKTDVRTPENVYNRFKVFIDIGESKVNESERAALLTRVFNYFAKDADSAMITIKIGTNPDLPIYFVQKMVDSHISTTFSDYVVTSSKTILPDEVIPVALQLKSARKLDSSLVQKGVSAATTIFDFIGNAPGASVISRIPKDAAKELDAFISSMGTTVSDLTPGYSITGSSLVDSIHYEILYYDKPKSDPSRAAIVKLVIQPEDFPSRYGSMKDGRFISAPSPSTVRYKEIDGKSPMGKVKADESLYLAFAKSENYDQYLEVCERVVNILSDQDKTTTDRLLEQHSVIMAINGGSAARNKKRECPRVEERHAMDVIGLSKLPIDSEPISLEEAGSFFNELLRDIVARRDVQEKIKGNIVVKQDVALLAGIEVGKQVELGNDELAEALAKSGIRSYSSYDFNPTKLGGTSMVRTEAKRYKLFLELDMEIGKPRLRALTIKDA